MVARLFWEQKVAGSNPVIPTIYYGAVAHLGERLPCTHEVASSILVGSTIILWLRSSVGLERLTHTQQVGGSNPSAATNTKIKLDP